MLGGLGASRRRRASGAGLGLSFSPPAFQNPLLTNPNGNSSSTSITLVVALQVQYSVALVVPFLAPATAKILDSLDEVLRIHGISPSAAGILRMCSTHVLLMIYILHYLEDPNYGSYGKFLLMGNAGFISSTVVLWG